MKKKKTTNALERIKALEVTKLPTNFRPDPLMPTKYTEVYPILGDIEVARKMGITLQRIVDAMKPDIDISVSSLSKYLKRYAQNRTKPAPSPEEALGRKPKNFTNLPKPNVTPTTTLSSSHLSIQQRLRKQHLDANQDATT